MKYISIEKAQILEEGMFFLSNLFPPTDGETYCITNTNTLSDKNVELTSKLQRLMEINNERQEILLFFKNHGK